MAEPISEQLTQNILATLQTITVAHGYQYDLIIEREKRRGNNPQHLLCVLHEMDPQEITDEVLLKDGWMQSYMLDIFIALPETDTTPPNLILNRVCADIHKALMADRQRANLAIDTYIRPYSAFTVIQGDLEGREFRFDVQYRHSETNPYTLG